MTRTSRSFRATLSRSLSLSVSLLVPLAACAVDDDARSPGDDVVEPGAGPDDPVPGPGQISVEFPWGRQLETYEIVEDVVVIRGDIIVGRADELGERSTTRVGGRWPGGVIRYAWDASIPAGDSRRTSMANAVAALEARTPLDFQLINNPCTYPSNACATDYILLRSWGSTGGQSATPNGGGQVGYLGGQQIINAAAGFSTAGYEHEIFHAIGMYHEQERNDRDDSVWYRPECTDPTKVGNFSKNADPDVDFGTYDIASIMQYSSATFRIAGFASAPCSGGYPLTRDVGTACPAGVCSDPGGDGFAEVINGSATMTANDIDAVWAMYAPGLTAHEAGDSFGRVLVHGDFDDDGRADLAVGAPYEDTNNNATANAGAVTLWKGTEDGLQPWRLITQASIGALEEANDLFGAALAVGDFDHDGRADLAIGTPGESVGGNPDASAGAVYILRGTNAGPVFLRSVVQSDIGASVEGGDRFGEALVVGRFNGDGIDDLAVAAPGETHGDGIASGHVYILRGTGAASAVAAWADVGQEDLSVAPNSVPDPDGEATPPVPLGTDQAGDEFGSSLAAGHVDDDGFDDLVVAAQCDHELATCAGGVYLYRGSASTMRGWMRLGQAANGAGDAWDYYGFSVAAGDVDGDGDDDILVGAPYDDVGGTANVGRVFWAQPDGHVIDQVVTMNQVGSDFGANDLFGYAIAIGQTGALDAIAIGAPGEAWGAGPAAGAVMMFHASDDGPAPDQILRGDMLATEETEDSFGFTVSLSAGDNKAMLVVGNPGEDAGAGAIMRFVASPIGSDFAATQSIKQTTTGTRAD